MIHYQLICAGEHHFDGWFKDSAAFDSQAASGLVECPECGGTKVHRALMSPAIGRSRKAKRSMVVDQTGNDQTGNDQTGNAEAAAPTAAVPAAAVPAAVVPAPGPDGSGERAGALMPDQVRAMLQRLRSEVEKNCEHVGSRFAEEARSIHRGETPARGIYGESTPEQAEALAEEGIEVARIPWVPRADG